MWTGALGPSKVIASLWVTLSFPSFLYTFILASNILLELWNSRFMVILMLFLKDSYSCTAHLRSNEQLYSVLLQHKKFGLILTWNVQHLHLTNSFFFLENCLKCYNTQGFILQWWKTTRFRSLFCWLDGMFYACCWWTKKIKF